VTGTIQKQPGKKNSPLLGRHHWEGEVQRKYVKKRTIKKRKNLSSLEPREKKRDTDKKTPEN